MSKARCTLLLALIGLIGIASLVLVHAGSENTSPKSKTAVPQPNQNLPRSSDPVQNIRFTIYDAGILPHEIKVQKGLVSIAIEDRTRKSEGLAVEREIGNERVRVGQIKRSQDLWRGRDQIRLAAGTYVVFDTNNPANQARLIVAP
jgi:hypothetical protein